jgi:hypothetical protein
MAAKDLVAALELQVFSPNLLRTDSPWPQSSVPLSTTHYQALPMAEKRTLIQRKGQRVASRYQ